MIELNWTKAAVAYLVVTAVTSSALGFYAWYRPASDYFRYESVEYKGPGKAGSLVFTSLMQRFKRTDIYWRDELYCKTNDEFKHFDVQPSSVLGKGPHPMQESSWHWTEKWPLGTECQLKPKPCALVFLFIPKCQNDIPSKPFITPVRIDPID